MAGVISRIVILTLLFIHGNIASLPIGEQQCYGSTPTESFLTDVQLGLGGTRRPLPDLPTFDCESCTAERLYCNNASTCLFLSSTMVHMFKNGQSSQPPILLDPKCSPKYIQPSNRQTKERVYVQCHSDDPDPEFERIELNPDGSWNKLTLRTVRGSYRFGNVSENSVVIRGEGEEDYIIVIEEDGRSVVVYSNAGSSEDGRISLSEECDSITSIHRSLPLKLFLVWPQFIVDCVKSDRLVRWAFTVNVYTGYGIQHRHSLYPTGQVFVSPNYFLFMDTSRITLVGRYNTDTVRATKDYRSLALSISSAIFLNDEWLLIEIDRLDRILINMTEFVYSTAAKGEYTLQNSTAYCPDGTCPPSELVDDRYLLLFVRDEDNNLYLDRFSYDLSNLTTGPTHVGRTEISDLPSICFSTITSPNTPVSPTTPSTTSSGTTSETATSSPNSHEESGKPTWWPWLLVVTMVALALLLIVVVIVAFTKKKLSLFNFKKKLKFGMQEETPSEMGGIKIVTPKLTNFQVNNPRMPKPQIDPEPPSCSSGYSTSSDQKDIQQSEQVQDGTPTLYPKIDGLNPQVISSVPPVIQQDGTGPGEPVFGTSNSRSRNKINNPRMPKPQIDPELPSCSSGNSTSSNQKDIQQSEQVQDGTPTLYPKIDGLNVPQ